MVLRSKKPTVDSLGKESDEIFSIFTKTQERCNQLNAKINAVVSSKQEEVNKLNAEITDLSSIAKKNSNLSDKINNFINS